jgi:sporulation protein YlmC with PRC-barrel domain
MQTMDSNEVEGKQIFSKDGRELGDIESIRIDVDAWKVMALYVKLRRAVLEKMDLKTPLLGTQIMQIKVEEFSGVADSAVLKRPLKDVLFSGGHPSADANENAKGGA